MSSRPTLLALTLTAFLTLLLPYPASSAEVPLDALSAEVAEIKGIVTSVQGSLLTSVRLIQGKFINGASSATPWTSDERTNHFVFFVGRGDGNIFDKNIFLASREVQRVGTQPKLELS
jgi:hypothetical protein